jgi:hypothetical protein
VSGDWDQTTANWIDLANSASTVFTNGDAAVFDDSASNSTVNVVGNIIPAGGTTISNSALNYTFSGGSISGVGGTVKLGNGGLVIQCTHNPALTISNGTFYVDSTAILNGGFTSRSSTIISNVGTINGPIGILAGGFVNAGTVFTAPGVLTTATNTVITNYTTLNIGGGDWSVVAGALFNNYGTVNHLVGRLNVAGTMIGDGTIHDSTANPSAGAGRLAVISGGVLHIGHSIGTLNVEGRFDATAGGNIIVEVDMANGQTNDLLAIDFAGNMQAQFTMTNVNPGAGVFSLGQVFTIMKGNFGIVLTNPAPAHIPLVSPRVPGVGMQWDVSGMRITNNVRTISIISVPLTNPPTITSAILGGTNLTLTWPTTHFGYQMQAQTNELELGLYTNWVPLAGSELTNRVDVPLVRTNPSVFYRLSSQ